MHHRVTSLGYDRRALRAASTKTERNGAALIRRSLLCAALASAAMAYEQRAQAQVPRCQGNDSATQASARAEGLRRDRAATARGTINRVEMAAALEAFEAQCRAGDINALEMRAYALTALGRHVEAAESLDAFLEARPLQTLDADARGRVGAQRGAILAEVATLSVEGSLTDSNILVNGRSYGAVPRAIIRLAPGEVVLQVFAAGMPPVRRTFTMGPGETRREVIEGPISGSTSGTSNPSAGTSTSTASATSTVSTASTASATSTVSTANTANTGNVASSGATSASSEQTSVASSSDGGGALSDRPPARGVPVLPIALGVGALAVGGAFIGATVWHAGRVDESNRSECNPPADAEYVRICGAVASERDAAFATQIATGVIAGGLLVGAGVTLGLWFASAPRARPTQSAFCTPSIGAQSGLLCGARF
jgi:hypothetical protein